MHMSRFAQPNSMWNRFMFLAIPRYAVLLYPNCRLTIRNTCSTLHLTDAFRCFNYGTAPHHESGLLETFLNVVEDGFSEIVFFQQVPKLQQRGRIRNLLLQEIDSYDLLLEMPNKSVFP